MNTLTYWFSSSQHPITVQTAIVSFLLALGLAQGIGAVYVRTFRGMSYSVAFVQAVSLGSVVACMVMLAINNSIAAGLGIAGSLAIIRFRAAIRDPRDMVFVFASMASGIAAGLRAYGIAIIGSAIFCAAALWFTYIEFGRQRKYDALLRFHLDATCPAAQITDILKTHVRKFSLVSLREAAQGQLMEHAYHLEILDPDDRALLLQALQSLPGIRDVALYFQEPTIEL